ncbi:glycosyltransferase family 2 protein [Hymenobacter lutimineralis]|uniref:Glycosyltransferase family 2 protein n=1 Tax=Hymenobacter lutimineralis TaxID=2606448 RepID=A0A5D6VHV9_9BACT|nr:glycosyltransferase family 2 protein [Hymenobacter lutimineralis]TYZ14318.1 glycosyltransferase family 2 protein [Hymenobacter lutimineralis]
MHHPLVSVIIPTYNRSALLVKALASVRAQTYPAIQLIVVDDGSTDNTRELLAGYPEVEYYYQANQRQAAARNKGLQYARGEFIASLDSDDTWEPDFLAKSINCLVQHQLDFVFLNHHRNSHHPSHLSQLATQGWWRRYLRQPAGEWWLLSPTLVRRLFLETCPAPSSALVIRRSSMVSNWNERMLIADDWCLILDMVMHRPCKAAFTLQPSWVKCMQRDNVYDGRENLEVIERLGLHDGMLLAERFAGQVTLAERRLLQRQLATHHLNFAHLLWKRGGHSGQVRLSIQKAFALAPLQSSYHGATMLWLFLRNRFRPDELASESV